MQNVYIIEAVRSPIGKRGKGLAGLMPADLLGKVQKAALDRAGVDPAKIGQVIGGCVSQVGEQSFNVARIAWLSQGLPLEVAATTVDSQCGSSQQATSLGAAMVASGMEDLVMCCGVEMMTRVPLGSNMKGGGPMSESYFSHYQPTSQFQGAAMIAEEYQITRADADVFGLKSQKNAVRAWAEGRFDREIVPIEAPVLDARASRPARRVSLRATKVRVTQLWKGCRVWPLCRVRRSTRRARARRCPTAPLWSFWPVRRRWTNSA